jgi:glycosyltransferase involved in cell wall biosynthesis
MTGEKEQSAVIFTLFYPYSTFDYYVDIEVAMICKHFKTVYIIPINDEKSIDRELPENAVLVQSKFSTSPLKALLSAAFSRVFWKELFLALMGLKLDFNMFKHIALQHAKVNFLRGLLEQKLEVDKSINLVYSHWLLEGVFAASMLKDRFSFKLVTKAHSLDIYKERHINNYIPFLRNSVNKIDQIHFISDLGKQYFMNTYNFKLEQTQLFVSRLGIENKRPFQIYESKGSLKIISVSYIYPLKRIDVILEAIALISEFDIEWHHIGAYYKDHTEKIKTKAESLLRDKPNIKVVWLGDYSIPQVYDYYSKNAFDLFVSASSSEGIPVSMMECMSFGIPVISTDVGGVKEIVNDLVNGYLIDANPTAQQMAASIRSYYNLPLVNKMEMRSNAHEKWRTTYNANHNFKKFIELAI